MILSGYFASSVSDYLGDKNELDARISRNRCIVEMFNSSADLSESEMELWRDLCIEIQTYTTSRLSGDQRSTK